MTTFQTTDLAKMRADAKISQEEMATHLGISQSQVSRYEQDPDNTPLGVAKAWVKYCGDISTKQGLEYGAPYRDIATQIKLMNDYAETAPAPLDDALFKCAPTADSFVREVRNLGRKPRVAACGRFDQGKSRLANTLMGSEALPTGYQPATAIISLVRHVGDRPSWIREEVWIMRKGFDLNQANDERHCNEYKIVAGSFDTLRKYGTHNDNRPADADQCFAALVFVDSPFLLGCDLLDLPGYGHSPDDHTKAELGPVFGKRLVEFLGAVGQGVYVTLDLGDDLLTAGPAQFEQSGRGFTDNLGVGLMFGLGSLQGCDGLFFHRTVEHLRYSPLVEAHVRHSAFQCLRRHPAAVMLKSSYVEALGGATIRRRHRA